MWVWIGLGFYSEIYSCFFQILEYNIEWVLIRNFILRLRFDWILFSIFSQSKFQSGPPGAGLLGLGFPDTDYHLSEFWLRNPYSDWGLIEFHPHSFLNQNFNHFSIWLSLCDWNCDYKVTKKWLRFHFTIKSPSAVLNQFLVKKKKTQSWLRKKCQNPIISMELMYQFFKKLRIDWGFFLIISQSLDWEIFCWVSSGGELRKRKNCPWPRETRVSSPPTYF